MVELSLIKYLLDYNNYNTYKYYISNKDFTDELKIVFDSLTKHYAVNETSLAVEDLANLVFSLNPKDKEYYTGVFKHLKEYTPVESTVVSLIDSVKEKNILQKISLAAYQEAEGKDPKGTTLALLEKLNNPSILVEENPFVTDDLEELIKDTYELPGLCFRLKELQESLGSLRQGDLGIVFARPEVGKTTFLADNIAYMLDQTDRDILWFNNEEKGKKVVLRVYQAYFGVTKQDLYENIQHYRKLFREQTGGRFKLYDSAQIDRNTVENLCSKTNPGLLVFDQLDKVEGFKAEREDLLLGAKYIWARTLAKRYAPTIAVTQADGTGEGVRWLTMAHVANAKTSKQAEADFILGIGAIPDTGWESIRFINISKNKLDGDTNTKETQRHAKIQVGINPTIARYTSLS